jgi:hypothetical protein
LILTKWDTVNATGYFELPAGSCAAVAEGMRTFTL